MALEIDDDLLHSIGPIPDELRLELAVHLYKKFLAKPASPAGATAAKIKDSFN